MWRASCTIVLAFLAGCAAAHARQTDLNAPTLVLVNGKVLTMDGQSKTAEAVAIRDGGRWPEVAHARSISRARPSFPD